MKKNLSTFIIVLLCIFNSNAQDFQEIKKDIEKLQQTNSGLDHRLDQLSKQLDDLMWQQKVGDIAFVDKLYICGPAKWKEKNPDAMGAGNPVKFWTYVFIPLNVDVNKKYPLIVLLLCAHYQGIGESGLCGGCCRISGKYGLRKRLLREY